MKIIVFGACGSGTTTLGKSLARQLVCPHLDADDYFWVRTDPPYQVEQPAEVRNRNLKDAFDECESVVVTGSLYKWGDYWTDAFDLGIFLFLPPEIRMQRLRRRETARYGDLLKTDREYRARSEAFLEWAEKYDDKKFEGKSIALHRKWMSDLQFRILEIDGDLTNEDRMNIALKAIADSASSGAKGLGGRQVPPPQSVRSS